MDISARDNLLIWIKELVLRIITFDYKIIKRLIGKELKLRESEKILDFGCGTGILAPLFKSSQYLGIDINSKLIAFARSLYKNYQFEVMSAENLEFPSQTFDKILIVGVVHHLETTVQKKTFDGLKKILKKGGIILAIEAIPPINKFNLLGKFLRMHDEGHHIVPMQKYEEIFSKNFRLVSSYQKHGGILDYGVFVLKH